MATPQGAAIDVTVMGGGIFGLSCAYTCAQRGARVTLVESLAIGAGASGGVVGALAPHVPEQWNTKKQFQLESLLMAERFWSGVTATGGIDPGYARLGRLQPLPDAAAVAMAQRRAETATTLWGDHARWALRPAADFAPWLPESTSGMVVHDTLSARIAPKAALNALVAAFKVLGGKIIIGDAAPKGVVIWATGAAGLAALSDDFGKPIGTAEKGQAALLSHDARPLPQLLIDGLHIVPHADGTVAIGSTSERSFDAPDTTDAALDALIAKARQLCPMLQNAPVIARWAGLRPRSKSRAPMLGPWPGRPGHFIANGGFKIGFGMAPKIAEVIADLVFDDRDDTIPDAFRVTANL